MVYLKATVVGLLCALILALASLGLPFVLMWVMYFFQRQGSGGLGAVSLRLGWTMLACVLGFVAGFYWVLHRSPKPAV